VPVGGGPCEAWVCWMSGTGGRERGKQEAIGCGGPREYKHEPGLTSAESGARLDIRTLVCISQAQSGS